MKKLIGILFLFVFSLFIGNAQPSYILYDTLKQVTVNVNSVDKKQLASIDNLQLQLSRIVDNQTVVNEKLSGAINLLSVGLAGYVRDVERRNKDSGTILGKEFRYSPERVKKVIKIERWLNFTTVFLVSLYFLWALFGEGWNRGLPAGAFVVKVTYYLTVGLVSYYLLLKLLTLIFNGDYYVIKELTQLFT